MSETVQSFIERLPRPTTPQLPPPPYQYRELNQGDGDRVALCVESMKRHMTDEGWQIQAGLMNAGYLGYGYSMSIHDSVDVRQIIRDHNPQVVWVQDKREWGNISRRDFRERRACFKHVGDLASREDIFKVTVLKDAQQNPPFHIESANEIGCHAWVCYYHPKIVAHLAPYVRPQHLIRTYHTIDAYAMPEWAGASERDGCLLSGAVSNAYPLRQQLVKKVAVLPRTQYVRHPGYHRDGCCTPDYLKMLMKYRVSICTSSRYGYALRKIVEAVACGCTVVTDLPVDEVLPEIDEALVRIPHDVSIAKIQKTLTKCLDEYDEYKAFEYAVKARSYYDYRAMGHRLSFDIERMRKEYNG